MLEYLVIALALPATTYQWGETRCGDTVATECTAGALTASGEPLSDTVPSAALPMPTKNLIRATTIGLRSYDGTCITVRVNDKSHPRWVGNRGLDLNRAALELLVPNPHSNWSGEVEQC
jgi:hypothetical protein